MRKLTEEQAQVTRTVWLPLAGYKRDCFAQWYNSDDGNYYCFDELLTDGIDNRDVVFACILWAEGHMGFKQYKSLRESESPELDAKYEHETYAHRRIAILECRRNAWNFPAVALYDLAVAQEGSYQDLMKVSYHPKSNELRIEQLIAGSYNANQCRELSLKWWRSGMALDGARGSDGLAHASWKSSNHADLRAAERILRTCT